MELTAIPAMLVSVMREAVQDMNTKFIQDYSNTSVGHASLRTLESHDLQKYVLRRAKTGCVLK
jgi:hypothetical protein